LIIRLTAFPPAPPTPITLITAPSYPIVESNDNSIYIPPVYLSSLNQKMFGKSHGLLPLCHSHYFDQYQALNSCSLRHPANSHHSMPHLRNDSRHQMNYIVDNLLVDLN